MHKIQLGVKCTQRPNDLRKFIKIARKMNISALEVCEMGEIMMRMPREQRVKNIIERAKGQITKLCFHYPLWKDPLENIRKADLASEDNALTLHLSKETIKEAAETGFRMDLTAPVLVNFHIMGFVNPQKVTWMLKKKTLRRGERALRYLQDFAKQYCDQIGFLSAGKPLIRVVRENNYPYYKFNVQQLVDFHPVEFTSIPEIGVNLDLAHFQLYLNHLSNDGPVKYPAVEIDKQIYPSTSWQDVIKKIKKQVELVHINDARGYTWKGEGLQVGTGEVPFGEIIPHLCKNLPKDIMGTIEIKKQHIFPSLLINSVKYLHNYFGEAFSEYFQ